MMRVFLAHDPPPLQTLSFLSKLFNMYLAFRQIDISTSTHTTLTSHSMAQCPPTQWLQVAVHLLADFPCRNKDLKLQ